MVIVQNKRYTTPHDLNLASAIATTMTCFMYVDAAGQYATGRADEVRDIIGLLRENSVQVISVLATTVPVPPKRLATVTKTFESWKVHCSVEHHLCVIHPGHPATAPVSEHMATVARSIGALNNVYETEDIVIDREAASGASREGTGAGAGEAGAGAGEPAVSCA